MYLSEILKIIINDSNTNILIHPKSNFIWDQLILKLNRAYDLKLYDGSINSQGLFKKIIMLNKYPNKIKEGNNTIITKVDTYKSSIKNCNILQNHNDIDMSKALSAWFGTRNIDVDENALLYGLKNLDIDSLKMAILYLGLSTSRKVTLTSLKRHTLKQDTNIFKLLDSIYTRNINIFIKRYETLIQDTNVFSISSSLISLNKVNIEILQNFEIYKNVTSVANSLNLKEFKVDKSLKSLKSNGLNLNHLVYVQKSLIDLTDILNFEKKSIFTLPLVEIIKLHILKIICKITIA